MTLFSIAAPQDAYQDRLKIVAIKLLRDKNIKIKQLIKKFFIINTSGVVKS